MDKKDLQKLSSYYIHQALKLKPGEDLWLEYQGQNALPLAEAFWKEATAVGAYIHFPNVGTEYLNSMLKHSRPGELEGWFGAKMHFMKHSQAYLRVKDPAAKPLRFISDDQKALYGKLHRELTDYRVNNTRWQLAMAPTEDFARDCRMEMAEFEQFYLKAICGVNYDAMGKAVAPLERMMARTNEIRIYAPNQETDLTFRKDGIGAEGCAGRHNSPDGEGFTAPSLYSMNGTIKFGPSKYEGERFEWIKLTFRDGKVISARAENDERSAKLNQMLEGGRYCGEFAISFNPNISHPTGHIAFDEKIDGALHFAMGFCYDGITFNGSDAPYHWDMVQIHRPEYGGGQIYFDGRLIRDNGIFVVPELQGLNPDNLKASLEL